MATSPKVVRISRGLRYDRANRYDIVPCLPSRIFLWFTRSGSLVFLWFHVHWEYRIDGFGIEGGLLLEAVRLMTIIRHRSVRNKYLSTHWERLYCSRWYCYSDHEAVVTCDEYMAVSTPFHTAEISFPTCTYTVANMRWRSLAFKRAARGSSEQFFSYREFQDLL